MRILIVEDDYDIVQIAKAYLEKEGFNVDVARDGLIGFEKATQYPPQSHRVGLDATRT
jgi:two-component system, OmpR family, response regulator AdeR